MTETTSHVDLAQGQEATKGEDNPNRDQSMEEEENDGFGRLIQEPELETQEERDKFYQEVRFPGCSISQF